MAICVLQAPDYVFEMANPFYEQLVRGRKVVGRKMSEVIPELPQDVWQAFSQVVEEGLPFRAREWYVPYDADGDGTAEDHWFDAVYHPLRNPDQSIRGLIAVLYEITQQVQARKEVERVNRELEEFAYVASHDLQEPLRMVNSFSQLLVRRYGQVPPEETERYADFLATGVKRMEDLISDLLSYARTVHAESPVLEPSSLQNALDEALKMLTAQIEEANAVITCEDLPTVLGEETQLTQVFQNLVSNALKYSKPDVHPIILIGSRLCG